VQEENAQKFTRRSDQLKFSLRLTDAQLAEKIGFSRRMLHNYRSGLKPITKKAWWKLEQAEREAGIIVQDQPATNNMVRETPPPYKTDNRKVLKNLLADVNRMKERLEKELGG
jgi:hypothetical protein